MLYLKKNLFPLLWNLLIVYVVYMLCRVVYFADNYTAFSNIYADGLVLPILKGGLLFDTSALAYMNVLYIVLFLLPFVPKRQKVYQCCLKVLFVGTNLLAVISNLFDSSYFAFTNQRTTASFLGEFSHESNSLQVLGAEVLRSWYLALFLVLMGFVLYRLYKKPMPVVEPRCKYYAWQTASLLLSIVLCVFGMRGGIGVAVRPITLSNANRYVNSPVQATLVLNTPFSIIRTLDKKPFRVPHYFEKGASETLYTSAHHPVDTAAFTPKNVVIFILESFGREYIGALNKGTGHTPHSGYTPFLDSIMQQSYTFQYSFANGRKSIDAMPSILSSIPRFVEPFFLTSAAMNHLTSLAGLLGEKGYYSAFFHGAPNGSMGFQSYARSVGFKDYFGMSDYEVLPTYQRERDFDGTWSIWDEEFFQFFCDKMSSFKPPFLTALFSASSHHPFRVPERYEGVFPKGELDIHQCVGYSDHALRKFFEKASKEAWFENTLFVFTGDHTSQTFHKYYQTDLGLFAVPVAFYDPSGTLPRRIESSLAQQIDIMPTVLSYLHYDKPYIAFGQDLLHTPKEKRFAVSYLNDVYQYVKGDYMLQFDGEKTIGLYAYETDKMLKHNLKGTLPCEKELEQELKAIIQQYMERMVGDDMLYKEKEK